MIRWIVKDSLPVQNGKNRYIEILKKDRNFGMEKSTCNALKTRAEYQENISESLSKRVDEIANENNRESKKTARLKVKR